MGPRPHALPTRLHGPCRTRRGVLRVAGHPIHPTTISGREPYKGKGVKYAGENIIRKEAKKA